MFVSTFEVGFNLEQFLTWMFQEAINGLEKGTQHLLNFQFKNRFNNMKLNTSFVIICKDLIRKTGGNISWRLCYYRRH